MVYENVFFNGLWCFAEFAGHGMTVAQFDVFEVQAIDETELLEGEFVGFSLVWIFIETHWLDLVVKIRWADDEEVFK